VAVRLEARRSEGAVRAAMSRWRGGVPAATCGRRRCRRFQVGIRGGDGGARGEARGVRAADARYSCGGRGHSSRGGGGLGQGRTGAAADWGGFATASGLGGVGRAREVR
jgi:hypothetical protein